MADTKITGLTDYTPPIDTDVLPIVDITTSNTKKITWANIKAALKTYFDSLTTTLTNKTIDTTTNTLPQVSTVPVELKISTASKGGVLKNIDNATGDAAVTSDGWIEDAKYGWYFDEVATAASAEFDSAVTRTGRLTLKAEAVDATGTAIVYNTQGVTLPILAMEAIPLKVSTVYRLSCWVKTALAGTNGRYLDIIQYDSAAVVGTTVSTNKLTGANDWTLCTVTFTSDNDAIYGRLALHNDVAGAVNQAWFDVNSMTLEEVVTDTTFTGKVPEKIRPVLQAVTSTDNIDNSLDPTGAYANTYALKAALSEDADDVQTFTPTKKYVTQMGVWVVEAGTSVDWFMAVHTTGNVVVAAEKIPAANIVEGSFNYFNIPNIWTSGALHFHLWASATTGTPTIKANTTDDLETCSFIQRYAKKSENFTVIVNGVKTELKSDKDGILGGAVIDLDNGKYWYSATVSTAGGIAFAGNIFSASAGGASFTVGLGWQQNGINGWLIQTDALLQNQTSADAVARNVVIKVNTLLPIKHLKLNLGMWNGANVNKTFAISSDNVNYTNLWVYASTTGGTVYNIVETDLVNGLTSFYIKFSKLTDQDYFSLRRFNVEASLDTSKIPTGLFYPLTVNQFTETVKLPVVATRIYFRNAKFTNEYGVLVPALEFTDGSAVNIGYVLLKLDNSQETNPCVSILSTTTQYQQIGTGSAVTGGYVLNDGEYMTLLATTAELKVDYQVGTGTTAIAAITKNVIFHSSDGLGVDSTQDPSHQMNAIVGVRQQGLVQRVGDVGEEIAKVRGGLGKQYAVFGAFSDSTTQTFVSTTVAYPITYDTVEMSAGVYRGSTTSQIFIPADGVYLINFSACIETVTANDHVGIWLRVNGTNVPRTNTVIQVPKETAEATMTVDLFYRFKAGDYFELVGNSQDGANATLLATAVGTTPDTPACPSIIVNVNKISE